ncbi:MAG: hypothetical protein R2684_08215 [Pyrinomonadaceae bacterium]
MTQKSTFKEILRDLERPNSERLMRRARRANRLAKKAKGRSKTNAYAVKSRALCTLATKLPEFADIRKDIVLTDFVVVELVNTNRGLHLPVSELKKALETDH